MDLRHLRNLLAAKPTRVAPALCLAVVCGLGAERSATTVGEDAEDAPDDKDIDYVSAAGPRSPAEEQDMLHVPPGFDVQLFAAEPAIGKPINIAFDAKGRLWVTSSSAYPFPAPAGSGSDRVTILEDIDGDGRADEFTDFATNLNIPIGILPYRNGAIVYSIPNIYFLEDSDNDDRSDKQIILLGEFDTRDTHGMVNNLIRGFDGWVHANHGFLNESHIRGPDGAMLTLLSGSTFKFRADGTRVTLTTSGRTNPFGTAIDRYGYLYSADSHSKPIYQVIEGGDYPSFGKAEPAFGFAPPMMRHSHGPTAIAGLAIYEDDKFPTEFQGNAFSGNVVSNRINRNAVVYHGATPEALARPDFLISDDAWFRPVDVELGPDGALYVADFYNKIIGHYEVPLDHPDRDKHRGRIWRIAYVGEGGQESPSKTPDLTAASVNELIDAMAHANLLVRKHASDQIVDRVGASAAVALRDVVTDGRLTQVQRAQALWALQRIGGLSEDDLAAMLADSSWLVRIQATRILAELDGLNERLMRLLRRQLTDSDPHVRRAALQAMIRHPRAGDIPATVEQLAAISEVDTHLRYVARLSIREQLRDDRIAGNVLDRAWTKRDTENLARIMVGTESAPSAQFVWTHLLRREVLDEATHPLLAHVAKYGSASYQAEIMRYAQSRFSESIGNQLDVYGMLQDGYRQRGQALESEVVSWGLGLAEQFLSSVPEDRSSAWIEKPLTHIHGILPDSWMATQVLPSGEAEPLSVLRGLRVGRLLSPYFEAPSSFTFRLFGSIGDGARGKPVSFVRMRLASTDEVIVETPLLDQREQVVTWDLSSHLGELVVFELQDGAPNDRSRNAFEAIAAGNFQPARIVVPQLAPSQIDRQIAFVADIAKDQRAGRLTERLATVLPREWISAGSRLAAAGALMAVNSQGYEDVLTNVFSELPPASELRPGLAQLIGRNGSPRAIEVLVTALQDESVFRSELAEALSQSDEGGRRLLDVVRSGRVSPQVLQIPTVSAALIRGLNPQDALKYGELMAAIEPVDVQRKLVIEQRTKSFSLRDGSIERGEVVFQGFCSICHQINDRGGAIGPQLDGIGRWGSERLIEKVIDPARTLNEGFRVYEVSMSDGRLLTMLFRRELGDSIVFANVGGAEQIIHKSAIVSMTRTGKTLMPENFGDAILKDDFDDLLAYLLSLR